MARYTATTILAFGPNPRSRAVTVDANGGSVVIAVWDGVAFIDSDTFTSDTTKEIFTANLRLRFTVSGGASFAIDEGDGL